MASLIVNACGGWQSGRKAHPADFNPYDSERDDVIRVTKENALWVLPKS